MVLTAMLLVVAAPGNAYAAHGTAERSRTEILQRIMRVKSIVNMLREANPISDADVPLSGPAIVAMEAEVEQAAIIEVASTGGEAQETPAILTGFTIRYLDGEGVLLASEQVAAGGLAQMLDEIPVREGFTLQHWINADSGEIFSFEQPVLGDVTLIPVYLPETATDVSAILQLGEAITTWEPEMESTDDALALGILAAAQEQEAELERESEPAEEAFHEVRVRLLTNGQLELGDSFTLYAELSGYEDGRYTLQWQYGKEGVWQDIEGAHEASLTQALTRENAGYSWRVLVSR